MINAKTAQAYGVYAALLSMCPDEVEDGCFVEGYVNCREQGLNISNPKNSKAVSVSESRNSDSIRVYYGERRDFSQQGNIPSEECYQNGRSFEWLDFKGAAKFIREHLELNF
jgi:hypothetical protein